MSVESTPSTEGAAVRRSAYDDATRARLDADAAQVVARYPEARSALLPLLHLVQSEDGYVSPAGIAFCAETLGLSTPEVSAVATFYTQYKRRPNGEYTVGVCTNTLCAVMGGDAIWEELSDHLGVGNDETTADGAITLERVECNAACDYAPVVMVNWEFFDNQTPESARELVDRLRAGAVARVAAAADIDGDLGGLAVEGLLQRDLHVVAQIGAAPRAGPAALAACRGAAHEFAEDILENIAERAEIGRPSATAAAIAERGMTVAIISGALLRVLQAIIGFADRLELRLMLLAPAVLVRMVFHREPAIGGFDRAIVGVARAAEQFVIIDFGGHSWPPFLQPSPRRKPGSRAARAHAGGRRCQLSLA